jgi:hypothetical protein
MTRTLLDGGCVLLQLRPREQAAAPKTRRPMTWRERNMALAFADYPELHSNGLAMAMFNHAVEGWEITDRQGKAIYAIARRYRVLPPGYRPPAPDGVGARQRV